MNSCIYYKKAWTRDGILKRKIQVIYIGAAVLITAILIVITIHMLFAKREEDKQQNIESRLPTGDYLPDAENPLIRVVIKTNGFKQIAHNQVQISATNGLIVQVETVTGGKENVTDAEATDGTGTDATDGAPTHTTQEVAAGEILTLTPDHELFKNGSVLITPKSKSDDRIIINSLTRGYGTPSYRGTIELFSTAEGIVIVNELPVEEYLYAVVPSEMPASYHKEALKCQAICARSYAYCQMLTFGYPEYYAHVDDSVSFQVYGNSKEQETTTQAVNETEGMKLWYQGSVVKTYYYSTSCGHSTSVEAWGTQLTEDNAYLKGVSICDEEGNAYEANLAWYHWEASIPKKTLENLIELNTGKEIGELKDIQITKQGTGGVALELTIVGTAKTITVETENKIRSVLGGSGYQITKQDGSVVQSTSLLPSAFFTVAKTGENYIIEGGGYGHGIGMSQNGANEMAKSGKTYEMILQLFYPGTQVN